MKNLARGSMLLLALMLLIGVTVRQQPVEAQVVIADNSQENILDDLTNLDNNNNNNNNNLIKSDNSENADNNNNKTNLTVKEVENSTDDTADNNENASGEEADTTAVSFRATAYCLKGRTASGSGVRRGIVAADPRVLPLGTRITISAGSWSGSYVVADTGGGVRGNKIDVWVPTCSEARQFGSRRITVRVHKKKRR